MLPKNRINILITMLVLCIGIYANAQKANVHLDPPQILIGDQARLFIEIQNNDQQGKLHWAVFPDTFNHLEIVEKGKIDTLKQGDVTTYKQRLLITGFDSGVFKIPSFEFGLLRDGKMDTLRTDSLQILVQTVAVDTTQAFKPIKGIILVKGSWLDYIWYIVGAILGLALLLFVLFFFVFNKKSKKPLINKGPVETLQQKTLRLLAELEAQQLWQRGQVKEYYVQLTDVLRTYIEERFNTPAPELTTDELLQKVLKHKEMVPYRELLANILTMADLAKFAKAEPLPEEHIAAMESAKQFVTVTKPSETPPTQEQ